MIVIEAKPVHAQTTSVSNLNAPSRALLGNDVRVTFTVTYSTGYSGYFLAIFVWDVDVNSFATGTAYSYPDACGSLEGTKYSTSAACGRYLTQSTSGSENVAFVLKFVTPKVYRLSAAAMFVDRSVNTISSSYSKQDFSISVSDKLQLDIRTQAPVVVTVDGVPQSPGPVFTTVYPGSHTISVPSTVDMETGKRLRFVRWSDGSTSPTMTVNLKDDAFYSPTYVTQYKLTLETSQGTATGDAWYDEGSTAEFSVPSAIPMTGIIGTLGGKFAFQGWYEGKTSVTPSNRGSITMNAPHTLTANWALDYVVPIVIVGIVALAAVGLAYYLKRKGQSGVVLPDSATHEPAAQQIEQPTPSQIKEEQPSTPSGPEKGTAMFCTQCGAKLPPDSKFCNNCGTKQP